MEIIGKPLKTRVTRNRVTRIRVTRGLAVLTIYITPLSAFLNPFVYISISKSNQNCSTIFNPWK